MIDSLYDVFPVTSAPSKLAFVKFACKNSRKRASIKFVFNNHVVIDNLKDFLPFATFAIEKSAPLRSASERSAPEIMKQIITFKIPN